MELKLEYIPFFCNKETKNKKFENQEKEFLIRIF